MEILTILPRILGTLLLVILFFNLMIAVHELGHFLAGKWRGLYIDRFQVWFGKPLWKKKVNGVQYGLGWLPLGGFVSLPQMAPMESIEGAFETPDGKPLPKVKPLDKIIVAFAGPLFSFLLAAVFAVIVYLVGGYPATDIEPKIGFVGKDTPAEKAGLQIGDEILEVDGHPIKSWSKSIDSVVQRIPLSTGKEIRFKVQRGKETLDITSGYLDQKPKEETENNGIRASFNNFLKNLFKRPPLRKVGIGPYSEQLVVEEFPSGKKYSHDRNEYESSPLGKILQPNDVLISLNNIPLHSYSTFIDQISKSNGSSVSLVIDRDGQRYKSAITPVAKNEGYEDNISYSIGFPPTKVDSKLYRPGIINQLVTPFKMVYRTLAALVNPNSGVGLGHMSGALGIGHILYELLSQPDGWRLVFWFTVVININLAFLNLLPLPILDGGHITMAIFEKIFGRPLPAKFLEFIMQITMLALLAFMLFVSLKDAGGIFNANKAKAPKIIYPFDAQEEAPKLTPISTP